MRERKKQPGRRSRHRLLRQGLVLGQTELASANVLHAIRSGGFSSPASSAIHLPLFVAVDEANAFSLQRFLVPRPCVAGVGLCCAVAPGLVHFSDLQVEEVHDFLSILGSDSACCDIVLIERAEVLVNTTEGDTKYKQVVAEMDNCPFGKRLYFLLP